MNLINKDLVVKEIPLFSNLSLRQREIIRLRSTIVDYKKGEIIYHEGSEPSGLYCVALGRVVIFTQDAYGDRKILEYLHRGKYFGIISLLTSEPHSVTAQAINDCTLLVISKEDFDFILKKIPGLAIDLSRTLSRRLKKKDIHQKTIFESTAISVFSSYSRSGKTIYVLNLALSLKKETHKTVAILDILPFDKTHTLPHRLEVGDYRVFDLSASVSSENAASVKNFILKSKFDVDLVCFYYRPEDDRCMKMLVAILSLLVNDYHYIILDLPSVMDRSVFSILNQSDLVHILSSPDPVDLARTRNLMRRLNASFNFPEEKIKIIINEYKLAKISYADQVSILGRAVYATLPKIEFSSGDRIVLDSPQAEYALAVRRISRELSESMVGLVLGVGVAYGFCHIGVLQVIEEENIPVDVIAGSSIGALIASLWVTGNSASQILKITEEFKAPKHIWNLVDLTLPWVGFIKGNKLRKFLERHLGKKTFNDVRLPLKIIASDVKRKEPKVLEEGLLSDAVMASCSMPGVFMPFKFKEEFLFDGGVINPLPTEALFKMGVKKIIAVNVTPSREDILRQYERIKEQITVSLPDEIRKKRWFSLPEYFKNSFKTNILGIVFGSIEILQSEVAKKEAQLADIVLHPDTSGMYWLELHRAREFAKRGEEEARRNLDKIRQVINE